ncbi:hypothetical protein DSLASN_17790 [Desulfoluna limicola]|uniref:Uncharacterized protein n=1 Tax=Desulfoluna limicola TaxID=2810562 RepID=A0ABM7PG82_9BACT|nr:hypothetical protein DSLASN_17790 [Desulfoluna limicola]
MLFQAPEYCGATVEIPYGIGFNQWPVSEYDVTEERGLGVFANLGSRGSIPLSLEVFVFVRLFCWKIRAGGLRTVLSRR